MNEIVEGIRQAIQLIVSLNPEVLDITARSLYISLSATLVASLIAIPVGGFIHFKEFGGKRGLITIIQTLYALPTVLVGLLVWLLLSRSGPFGFLQLLFTPTGMIIGQIVLIVPLMIGMTLIALSGVSQTKQDTVISLGATQLQTVITIVKEARFANHMQPSKMGTPINRLTTSFATKARRRVSRGRCRPAGSAPQARPPRQ